MLKPNISRILKQGEGISIEFKECKNALTKEVYETVCSFLNRNGGELLLGVKNNGELTGINKDAIKQIKKDFVTAINNPQKMSPPVYLSIEEIEIKNKSILYIFIPEGSQVQKCNNRIYDRNEDGDFDITNNHTQITKLYLNKQTQYTENKVYPYCKLEDFSEGLINKARNLAVNQNSNHPWKNLTNIELLKSAKLYTKDYETNKEGFTLASILLFGKDETILSALPHHKTDLILRIKNLDRYDDRDDVRTNLIDSYERIIAFAQKNLPDPFHMEGTQRISVRDKIFREIASNILIHREYSNHFPAKIIIERNRIYSENANKPHGHGKINPNDFSPFPKNPVIARVFKEMGLADELGSGIRNLMKYVKIYSNSTPELIEEDIFKIIIPLNMQATMQATTQAKLVKFCLKPRSREEMQEFLKLKNREHFRKTILKSLLEKGLLFQTEPDKPTSPNQRYYSKENLHNE